MRIDTGVKRAIAYRLNFLLQDVVEDYYNSQRNFILQTTLTATQRANLERRFRKEVNALRIVISMCATQQQRTELPSWFAVIPAEEMGKNKDRPRQSSPFPKTKPKTSKDTGSTGHEAYGKKAS